MPVLVIRVLGELELELDGRLVDAPPRRSARLLLGYLALNRGLHARADLAGLLWPDVLDASARASLRSALAAVRRTLGTATDRHLVRVGDMLGLAGPEAGVSVDLERFDELVARGDVEAALELPRGQLLQGLDAEWVRQARAEHVGREADLWATLAAEAEARGSLETAVRYARRRVAISPLAEPPNRELIRLLAAAGDRASALEVYAQLAERFRRELQAVPSAQTRELAETARRGAAATRDAPERFVLPHPLTTALKDPFVNRADELDLLTRALAAASDGERRAVVVAGEPGIGKSALVARFAAGAASTARVLLGRCAHGGSAPLDPFVEAIRHYVAHASDEMLARELPPSAGELSGLIPQLAHRLLAAPVPADLLEDGARIARAIVDVLLTICRHSPLLLIVEDLHEAHASVGEVLEQLLRRSERIRLAIVATVRSTEIARSPVLQRMIREIRRDDGGTYLLLEGLEPASIAELARLYRSDDLTSEQLRALHSRTRGNPLFAAQLLARSEAFGDWPLPDRVQDVIADELVRLGADAQRCLATASVLGSDFDLATLKRVSGVSEDLILDVLDESVAANVIRELPLGVGQYAFRHELIREGIYWRMTATRRAYLHKRAADTLRRETGSARTVAEHLRCARDLVPAAELAEAVIAAAEDADARRTYRECADLYAEALELIPSRAERRCNVLIAHGHARRRAGESTGVSAAFLEAGRAAVCLERPDLVTAAALGLCSPPFFAGEHPVDPSVIALLERALATLTESQASERARLLARLAAEQFYDTTRPRPDGLAQEAVALARDAGEPRALAAALDVGHLAFRENPAGRLALASKLVGLARERHEPEVLVPALVHQTIAEVELGALDALDRNAQALSDLAAESVQPAYEWWAGLWRATGEIARAEFDRGEALACHAYEAGRTAFGVSAELEFQAQKAWLLLERGEVSQLMTALSALNSAFPALPVWSALRARVLSEVGPPDDAARALAQLARDGYAPLERDTNWLISSWLMAEAVARTGQRDAAAELRAALEPRSDQWAVSARGTVCLGPLAGALALLAAVEGDSAHAEAYRRAALERCAAVGAHAAADRTVREYDRCIAALHGARRRPSSHAGQRL